MTRTRIAHAHADWLGLLETTGVFLTVPVLRRVFPNGIDPAPDDIRAEVRRVLDTLGSSQAERTAWIRWVLHEALGLAPVLLEGQAVPDTATHVDAEHGEVLRPDYVVIDPSGRDGERRLRLLVMTYPAGTRRDLPVAGRWAATPLERAAVLSRGTRVELVLATDGDWFSVVHAPIGQSTASATWLSGLFVEERGLLDSFVALLSARRFHGVGERDTLEAMLAESALAQEEVTDALGGQVRRAVELLVLALSRANREHGGRLLERVAPEEVYAAALTVMMRLVFILYAEERDLLPGRDPLYAASYGILGLRAQLQEDADRYGGETLERRHAAWHRILATCRAIHGGIGLDRLRLPAYGGSLFDPDRYAFLEGRQPGERWRDSAGRPLPVDDRSMLAILTALQVLVFRDAGVRESRPLSYRSLDVEQIGYVYEGLLDHGAINVDDLGVSLRSSRPDGPELAVSLIEANAARGQVPLVRFLHEQTRLSDGAITRALGMIPNADDLRGLREACENDEVALERVRPYLGLVARDLRDLPLVFLPGSIYVTKTTERRDTGTQYTPKELADEIVEFALQPLVYEPGPISGALPEDWRIRRPEQILDLRVCDPAVGSGAILVAACRYLTERVIEAVRAHGWTTAPPGAPDPDADAADVELAARRLVVDNCLFGVDRNPLAAEMAKLSLWLVTLSRERPFTFLDHAIRVGDSLLGMSSLDQVRWLHLDPERGRALHRNLIDVGRVIEPFVDRAVEAVRAYQEVAVVTVRDAEEKRRLSEEADAALRPVWIVGNAVVGKALLSAQRGGPSFDDALRALSTSVNRALDERRPDAERDALLTEIADRAAYDLDTDRPPLAPPRRPLHWPLAFPEIFIDRENPGFDAFVGNPPFQGGQRLTGVLGTAVREYFVRDLADGRRGSADLVAYFFLRASTLLRSNGAMAFFATNTIAQGGTREVGLDQLVERGMTIHRATKSRQWPGAANVQISQVGLTRGSWTGFADLDGSPVPVILPSLDAAERLTASPRRLAQNAGKMFQGAITLGMGFTMPPEEAEALITRDERNRDVLFPFLNADDVATSPTHAASRWIINFHDWPEERARTYLDCWAIVEERVKPDRLRQNDSGGRRFWWRYLRPRPELQAAIAGNQRVLVMPGVSKVVLPVFLATGSVWSHALFVSVYDDEFHFGLLTSALHWWWVIQHASTLESRIRYTPTDVFETFPQPARDESVAEAGAALDARRRELMPRRGEGLTATYNRVNDPDEAAPDIVRLREDHVRLDEAVIAAYGWTDIELGHRHYDTRIGRRFTISPDARREVLARLLDLNQTRHAEEVASGAHMRPGAGRRRRREAVVAGQLGLDREAVQ